ncbi:hypothetical protein BDM02DRAFT_3173394 [Thelephora ganbajun]|uniref:Uncharacterized protein n=1 Tax=Thelephora ganbajun TaxID=370292 RepID=A0ACB6Z702_THEGA|nr:hypothetical protein BDM02DRAFT_3173394 [Thelephora ganbajun]
MAEPPVINIHTPTASFSLVHSITQESLAALYDKLSRKAHTDYHGERVSPGWLKYRFNNAFWQLDDESDYTIFVWRQKSSSPHPGEPDAPTIHLRNPNKPLPGPSDYRNPSFHMFLPSQASTSTAGDKLSRARSIRSARTEKSTRSKKTTKSKEGDKEPAFRKAFDKFHSENGVRTLTGCIGPVGGVRMLLKNGYRHVYMSRKFAVKHGFVPKDASLGYYGYSGLIDIGSWPIRLNILNDQGERELSTVSTSHAVYLSEEHHFDVILGRSFMEKRQVKLNPLDPTDVKCLDARETVDCEVVILKDGRGQIVTVT